MDDSNIGIAAVVVYICMLVFSVWRNRNTPGFWSAEAIRARGRLAHQMIAFGGSIAGMMVCATDFSRAPVWFSAWGTGFAIVAWLCRPQWLRAKRHVNSPAPNPDDPSEPN
jgi:hypothetical protein